MVASARSIRRQPVSSGEAAVDNPIQKCRDVRIELEQQDDRRLSESVNLKIVE